MAGCSVKGIENVFKWQSWNDFYVCFHCFHFHFLFSFKWHLCLFSKGHRFVFKLNCNKTVTLFRWWSTSARSAPQLQERFRRAYSRSEGRGRSHIVESAFCSPEALNCFRYRHCLSVQSFRVVLRRLCVLWWWMPLNWRPTRSRNKRCSRRVMFRMVSFKSCLQLYTFIVVRIDEKV